MTRRVRLLIVSPSLSPDRVFQNDLLSAGVTTLAVRGGEDIELVRAFAPNAAILEPYLHPSMLYGSSGGLLRGVPPSNVAAVGKGQLRRILNGYPSKLRAPDCNDLLTWPPDAKSVLAWLQGEQFRASGPQDFQDALLDAIASEGSLLSHLTADLEVRSDLQSGRISGYDLVPFARDCRGIEHEAILRAVERHNLDESYCAFLFEEAFRLHKRLRAAGRPASVGVRIGQSALWSVNLELALIEHSLRFGSKPDAIRLSAALPTNPSRQRACLETMQMLGEVGVRVAVALPSDFRLEASGLRRTNIQEVLFDSNDIGLIRNDISRIALIKNSVIALKSAGLLCTIQNMESEIDMRLSLELGMSIGQGRYWGFPVPREAVIN